ncbi:hypothetical protein HK100_007478 [Physocladia obscura]|uniref:Uncharacterized protein n=1 Tax=Physocladia obscura TaxID=109957 RepID=A0AAD5XFT5_9FUNG|nr:hypothetical protein HK100_007478 [Physocladia obscura]
MFVKASTPNKKGAAPSSGLPDLTFQNLEQFFSRPPPTYSELKNKIAFERERHQQQPLVNQKPWKAHITDDVESSFYFEPTPGLESGTNRTAAESQFGIESSFDALGISCEKMTELMTKVSKTKPSDKESALVIIREWFNLCFPTPQPRSLLEPENSNIYVSIANSDVNNTDKTVNQQQQIQHEDTAARDTWLAEYYYNALIKSYSWGFHTLQSACWLALFSKTHQEYIGSKGAGTREVQLRDAFLRNLKKTTASLICSAAFTNSNQLHRKTLIFDTLDSQRMIEYFISTYVRHERLIRYCFMHARQLETRCTELVIDDVFELIPLSKAVPEEKWEDYLRAEADRVRREKETEIELIERAKWEAEEKKKLDYEALIMTEAARIRRQNMVITVAPIESHPRAAETLDSMGPDALFFFSEPSKVEGNFKDTALSATLSQAIVPLVSHVGTHIDKIIEYQSTEIAARFAKLATDRLEMKKYEREDEERMAQWQQQQAQLREANAIARNGIVVFAEEREKVVSGVAKGKKK